jgi:hypothetical protein
MSFSDFPCNSCGWCCKRTPCPLGLYLGETPLTPCSKLVETSEDKFECGLIINESDPLKKEAAKSLMLAGEGCSHIYGPSPISLIKDLVKQGLTPDHSNWNIAKENTVDEYKKIASTAEDKRSIIIALEEFINYTNKIESEIKNNHTY